jgi:radical SAM protein with 4Fe4S-binding SPASM domain|tara:strand:- start:376 stop:1611 length:1236 start_codon:yes stop_codon:yes gene_type:complete
MSKPCNNFCIIPWIHYNVWPNGKVYQCCITDYKNPIGNLNTNTIEEIWNNDSYKNLRTDLLTNNKPSSCSKCFEQEDNNITSFRQNANKMFSSHIENAVTNTNDDGSFDEMKLVYWDFRFSNLCNMKCRMCGGHLSSMWNADEVKLYGKASEPNTVVNVSDHSKTDVKKILNDNLQYVEEIYFAGGEPLIMDEHYYILERLIETGRTDVRIRYNTNLLKLNYKKWNVVDLWSKFDSVNVIASIDSFGSRAEYIRNGTVWDTVLNNIKTLVSLDNVSFGLGPTIQLLNIFTLPEFVDSMLEVGLTPFDIHLNNVLTGPEWYHINTMSMSDKEKVKHMLLSHADNARPDYKNDLHNKYNSIISYMNNEIISVSTYKQFIQITDKLDKIRNEDFNSTFPELHDHYIFSQGKTNE